MSQVTNISIYQPMLQAIAYRMVGCMHDAEDMVQDAFLKYLSIDQEKVLNTKAYLIRSVTNNCLNHINSLKEKKKEYLESVKLPELFSNMDFGKIDFKVEMDAALKVLHKKLGPLERALFLLREGFDFEYDELQQIFNKKKENCRQMVCRAKEKLSQETDKLTYHFDSAKYFEALQKACKDGNFQDLIDHMNDEQESK
ncbi:MAG: RNA polymerase sigma-70 factor (ECF subfamily) [Marinoscillum sp.]|jgi:RNA polymerase sigma factor (sigma-70 family)